MWGLYILWILWIFQNNWDNISILYRMNQEVPNSAIRHESGGLQHGLVCEKCYLHKPTSMSSEVRSPETQKPDAAAVIWSPSPAGRSWDRKMTQKLTGKLASGTGVRATETRACLKGGGRERFPESCPLSCTWLHATRPCSYPAYTHSSTAGVRLP